MRNQNQERKFPPLVLHLLGWSFLALFLVWQPLSWQVELPTTFWIKSVVQLLLLVGIFYLNYYYIYPRFLAKNKNLIFVVLNILSVLMLAVIIEQLKIRINFSEHMDQAFHAARTATGGSKPKSNFDYFALLNALIIIGISTSIAAVKNAQSDREFRQELEKQKINSELSFLKAQINPHFFFNTLNNIYALTVIDVEAAQKALHKLSRLMRYVLYETQKETVLLSQEIAFAEDYIQLMRLRLTDKVTIELVPPSPLLEVAIAPMLFLPFIENAFKHGISALEPSHIFVHIEQDKDKVFIDVKNTLFDKKSVVLNDSNGIGLVNTQRRLELLYPGKYQLEVKEDKTNKSFEVRLELETA